MGRSNNIQYHTIKKRLALSTKQLFLQKPDHPDDINHVPPPEFPWLFMVNQPKNTGSACPLYTAPKPKRRSESHQDPRSTLRKPTGIPKVPLGLRTYIKHHHTLDVQPYLFYCRFNKYFNHLSLGDGIEGEPATQENHSPHASNQEVCFIQWLGYIGPPLKMSGDKKRHPNKSRGRSKRFLYLLLSIRS